MMKIIILYGYLVIMTNTYQYCLPSHDLTSQARFWYKRFLAFDILLQATVAEKHHMKLVPMVT